MLIINNLSFSFDHRQVLQNFCLQLETGEIGTLIGASGSGKTTLLKLLVGSIKPTHGEISIVGCSSNEVSHYIAYMTQDDLLLPWRKVIDNLLLVGELGRQKRSQVALRQEANLFLKELGLADYANAYPDQLSGGMRQRVSLARTLMQKRPLLLLDEPFGALDVALREQLYSVLIDIRRRFGTTILMVTHDFRDALALSDKIFMLEEGSISQEWAITDDIRHDPLQIQRITDDMRSAFV